VVSKTENISTNNIKHKPRSIPEPHNLPILPYKHSQLKDKTNLTFNNIKKHNESVELIKNNKINDEIIDTIPEEFIMKLSDQHETLINKILVEEEEFMKFHKNHIDTKVE